MVTPEVPHGRTRLSAAPQAADEPTPEPEVLSFGPAAAPPAARRGLLIVGLALTVLLAGLGVWKLIPRPAPDFTLADLQSVYAGMVRADGLNEVSVITRDKLTERPVKVIPASCAPLFDATLSNQFPSTALDGVSTYWLNEGSATISLVSYRYPDPSAAQAQLQSLNEVLDACTDVEVEIYTRSDVALQRQRLPQPKGTDAFLSFQASTPPARERFTTDVVQVANTVTWQYRYEFGSRSGYSPLAGQQLLGLLVSQLRSVQDSNR